MCPLGCLIYGTVTAMLIFLALGLQATCRNNEAKAANVLIGPYLELGMAQEGSGGILGLPPRLPRGH